VEIVENSLWKKLSTGGAVFSTAFSTEFSTGNLAGSVFNYNDLTEVFHISTAPTTTTNIKRENMYLVKVVKRAT
jgi:hypothetical protein